jgi:HK97 family phage prohead protease
VSLDAELAKLAGIAGAVEAPFVSGKALATSDGALIIEGIAADFALDREGETFTPGVLAAGLRRYMEAGAPLCFHHRTDQVLGQVEDAYVDGAGLHVKARVEKPSAAGPLLDVYEKIKRGVIRGLSIGGIFKTDRGGRIYSADIVEISATATPVQPGARFVVTGKALGLEDELSRLTDLTAGASPLDDALGKLRAL